MAEKVRIRLVHPSCMKKMKLEHDYITAGLQSYTLRQNKLGHWYIVKYKGGWLHKSVQGTYTTKDEAHRRLVSYIVSTDKWGKAIYPGCPEQRRLNFIVRSLKDS